MKLTVILPTEAKLEEAEKVGLLSRWKFYFSQIGRHLDIEVYSCDAKNFSDKLNVKHIPLPFSLAFIPYGNQIFCNLYLFVKAAKMQRTLRVISASYFILPLLKIWGKKIILSYHYDYEITTVKNYKGIKRFTAER